MKNTVNDILSSNSGLYFALLSKLPDKYIKELLKWRNQEFVRNKMFNNEKIKLEEHLEYVKNNKDKILIGFLEKEPFCVINFKDYDGSGVELGYYLIKEDSVGGGLGAIMEFYSLYYAFFRLKALCVFCRTLKSNAKVIGLHKRFGFKFTKKGAINNKEYVEQRLCKEEWEKQMPKLEKLLKVALNTDNIDYDAFID